MTAVRVAALTSVAGMFAAVALVAGWLSEFVENRTTYASER